MYNININSMSFLRKSNYMMIPERLKLATLAEVAFNSTKHEACGKTVGEALERLTELCRCHGKPEPKQIPEYKDSYYCGIVGVQYMIKKKYRYNPVWFRRQNDMIVATVYFNY